MTREQFLAALASTPRTWILDQDGRICKQSSIPLYLFYEPNSGKIDNKDEWDEVIYAVVNFIGHDPNLRRELLKACGLEAYVED